MEFEDFGEEKIEMIESKFTWKTAIIILLFILSAASIYYGIRADYKARLAIEAFQANAAQIETLRLQLASQAEQDKRFRAQVTEQMKALGEEW